MLGGQFVVSAVFAVLLCHCGAALEEESNPDSLSVTEAALIDDPVPML
jgi:hypothetical protein